MEGQESIGSLPEDLMNQIVYLTSLQAVASLWMSSRYWQRKLSHLMDLRIEIVEKNSERSVFVLKQGKVFHTRIKTKTLLLLRKKFDQMYVNSGHLNTAAELQEFIQNIRRILLTLSNGTTEQLTSNFFMKISSKNALPSYYSGGENLRHIQIDTSMHQQLWSLIKQVKWVSRRRMGILAAESTDGIALRIINSNPYTRAEVLINAEGDMEGYVIINNYQLAIQYQTRVSPVIYQQLADIAQQYGQEQCDSYAGSETVFDFTFASNDKRLHIQYNTTIKIGQQITVTNGCTLEAVDKIIQVLEPVLYNPNIAPVFEGQVTYAPPLYVGHQLARIPHYRFPFSEHLSSIVAIDLVDTEGVTSVLDLTKNAPHEEVVALFKQVEAVVDYKCTEEGSLMIRTNQGRVISKVWIHSVKSGKPLFGSTLSEALVLKIYALVSGHR